MRALLATCVSLCVYSLILLLSMGIFACVCAGIFFSMSVCFLTLIYDQFVLVITLDRIISSSDLRRSSGDIQGGSSDNLPPKGSKVGVSHSVSLPV